MKSKTGISYNKFYISGGSAYMLGLRDSLNRTLNIEFESLNPIQKITCAKKISNIFSYSILIGSAGMAAHLAGALKAHSILPVIGVPLPGGISDGMDALLATVQMPKGVPVATMSVGKHGMINAAILCAEILALNNSSLSDKLLEFKTMGAKL